MPTQHFHCDMYRHLKPKILIQALDLHCHVPTPAFPTVLPISIEEIPSFPMPDQKHWSYFLFVPLSLLNSTSNSSQNIVGTTSDISLAYRPSNCSSCVSLYSLKVYSSCANQSDSFTVRVWLATRPILPGALHFIK